MKQRKSPLEKGNVREMYESSHKFQDWVHRMGVSKSPLARWLSYLQETIYLRQLLVVFAFSLATAYVLNFDIRPDFDYQVGDSARTEIVSPLTFSFIDEQTTETKRREAQLAVPVILDFEPGAFERVSAAVYRSFRLMRSKMQTLGLNRGKDFDPEMLQALLPLKEMFEKEIGFATNDYIFEWWVERRFNARFENILIRTLENWYQWRITDGAEKYLPPNTRSVIARELQKGKVVREFEIRTDNIRDISQVEYFQLAQLRGLEKVSPDDIQTLLKFARALLEPNLTLNKQEIEARRQAAGEAVLPVNVTVKKGQVIAAQGATITPTHLALIDEIDRLQAERGGGMSMVSVALLLTLVVVISFQYLRKSSAHRLKFEMKDLWVMGLVLFGVILTCKVFLFLVENAMFTRFGSGHPSEMLFYLAPLAAAAMLVGLLIQTTEIVWIFSSLVAIVIGIMSEFNLAYMLVTFLSGVAGARGVYNCVRRSDIYRGGLRAGVVAAVSVFLCETITQVDAELYWVELLWGVPAAFFGGIISSFVAMTLIPFLESVFNYTTDVRLLELSNLNHPLLKEMIVKAPGTYHHSMMVGSMVEAAAEEIGANPLLGKVMCYYHDIGKMEHARYFIENQKPGNNPHDHISPYMSRTLLVAHVKDGVELGMKYNLGAPIIDGVLQHHGTTLISFFYNKAIDQAEEGEQTVAEEEFRYPGPKPQFREAALCMLADSIEAAARSLDEPTPVRLQNIVRNIVQKKFIDGQLDECSLTLRDLSKVEDAFIRILLGIYHQRIDYPRGTSASEPAPVSPWGAGQSSR